jgi:hypothetical protein
MGPDDDGRTDAPRNVLHFLRRRSAVDRDKHGAGHPRREHGRRHALRARRLNRHGLARADTEHGPLGGQALHLDHKTRFGQFLLHGAHERFVVVRRVVHQ